MKTENDATNAVWKIEKIKSNLICKILNHNIDTIAINDLMSIAQIDEGELNRVKESINSIISEAKKRPMEKALEGSNQKTESPSRADIIDVIGYVENLAKQMVSLIQNVQQEQVMNMLTNNCRKAHDEQERGQQLEVIREEINRVFDRVFELRLKGFVRLEKMIAEVARPVENEKPITELRDKTTETIKLIVEKRLQREKLKDYMDSEISKIYTCREMREYEELWEQAKDASADETVELIYQAIQGMEDKMKADFESCFLEQNGQDETKDTKQGVYQMIKNSLSEAGVQDTSSDWSEIFKDLIEVFTKRDILIVGLLTTIIVF